MLNTLREVLCLSCGHLVDPKYMNECSTCSGRSCGTVHDGSECFGICECDINGTRTMTIEDYIAMEYSADEAKLRLAAREQAMQQYAARILAISQFEHSLAVSA